MRAVTVKGISYRHTCQRCGEKWWSLKEKPVKCARCGNPGWNRPPRPGNYKKAGSS